MSDVSRRQRFDRICLLMISFRTGGGSRKGCYDVRVADAIN